MTQPRPDVLPRALLRAELYDAAAVDGWNRWQRLRNVTIPSLRPMMIFVVTLTLLASANMFGQGYLTTQGAPAERTRTAIVSPLVWMFLTAFKSEEESAAVPPTMLPSEWTLESFDTIFQSSAQTPVFRWFLNSVIAALGMGVVVLATAAPAAYALARLEFRGKRLVFAMIVATLLVPPIIFLAPNYEIVDALGWLDTLPAVTFPLAAGAFGVFFLRQFFVGLPRELEEAALLDGASR